jgi:hypothetical protein
MRTPPDRIAVNRKLKGKAMHATNADYDDLNCKLKLQ